MINVIFIYKERKMISGAVIVFIVSVIVCGLIGIYAGFHVKDDTRHKSEDNSHNNDKLS
jgi:hypothetical protein